MTAWESAVQNLRLENVKGPRPVWVAPTLDACLDACTTIGHMNLKPYLTAAFPTLGLNMPRGFFDLELPQCQEPGWLIPKLALRLLNMTFRQLPETCCWLGDV